jgi:integrase/recombinase XerD
VLTAYRRHRAKCPNKADRISTDCRCQWWATGTLFGKPYRKSLKTRNKEAADKLIRKLERGEEQKQKPQGITIKAALDRFIEDCEARNLNFSTLGKYRRLSAALQAFAERHHHVRLADLTRESLGVFRNEWKLAPRTAGKQLERLRAIFRFAVDHEWIASNPAQSIKAPKVKPNPTLPFSDGDVAKILAHSTFKEQVFYRLLLNTGLRILDGAQLRPEKIVGGKVFLHTEKTGVPVFIPLPPDLLAGLEKLPLVGGFFFAHESDRAGSIAEFYRKKLKRMEKKPGIPNCHAHRFRDTFSVNLLIKGVPIEIVSKLLGHSSVRITEQHYAPWISARQSQLEAAIMKTWDTPKLKLVKK